MSTEANLNAGRPVQVGAHSPEPATSETFAREQAGRAARGKDHEAGPWCRPFNCTDHPTVTPATTAQALIEHQWHGSPQPDCAWCPVPAESVGVSDEAVEAASDVIGAASPDLAAYPDRLAYTSRAALEAAAPLMGATPVASREQVEQVVRRVYIDGGASITVAQEGAADIVGALLAAGVFTEPPTRKDLIWAMCRADRKEPEGKSADWLQFAEETFGRYADAVLALMGGAE